jgi:hypothetical protein
MVSWNREVVCELQSAVKGDLFWEEYLRGLGSDKPLPWGLHLAVLLEPYLTFILRGDKTVESRFSSRRFPPYGTVGPGDVLILKRQSGPVVGVCKVSHAWFYRLDPKSWKMIRREFTAALCAQDPEFWKDREAASFATLMALDNVRSLPPISCAKRDRRGWVVLRKAVDQLGQ